MGYVAGTKVKGRKRHAMVDTDGRASALQAHAADIQDRDGAIPLLQATRRSFPFVETAFVDSAYARQADGSKHCPREWQEIGNPGRGGASVRGSEGPNGPGDPDYRPGPFRGRRNDAVMVYNTGRWCWLEGRGKRCIAPEPPPTSVQAAQTDAIIPRSG